MGQMGFFDLANRYGGLDAKNDPLLKIDAVLGWEDFRADLEAVWRKPAAARKSRAGRKLWDAVVMFKAIILCALYNLSDDQVEYQIRDRLSFMRFLGLGLEDRVPDAKTVWLYREQLARAGAIEGLFAAFDGYLKDQGYLAMGGQIIDASIVAAPKQRNSREVTLQTLAYRLLVPMQDRRLPLTALLFQPGVEALDVRKLRQRHHHVAPRPANQTFHVAFVIPLAGATIAIIKQVVRQHLCEHLRPTATAICLYLRNQTAIVVVNHRQRYRAKEAKGVNMPVHPGLRCGRVIGSDVTGVALGQIKRKEVNLLLNTPQHNNGFAEVRLPMPGRMCQRNEHLPCLLTMASNIVLHRRVSAGEPFLFAKPAVNPLRRVALFLRDLQILQKPRINVNGETVQLRTANILLPTVSRRHRKRAHLVDGSTRQAKITRNRTLAAPLIKMCSTHLQIVRRQSIWDSMG